MGSALKGGELRPENANSSNGEICLWRPTVPSACTQKTHTGTHTLVHAYVLSVVVRLHRVRVLACSLRRVTKSTVFCVSTAIPHIPYLAPQQACLEVQASKTTHARARAPLRGFFHMNFLFSLLTLHGFNSLAQTLLNSPEWLLKSFLLCKRH